MEPIGPVRARLEAADQPGRGLEALLQAAWEAFGVLARGCRVGADRYGELFAAFSFACVAAAQGRQLLWAAPSLPQDCGWETSGEEAVEENEEQLAGDLAGLAGVLSARLAAAASQAKDAGDGGACADAAQQAGQIHTLLAPGAP
jgi:hypothetical protein